ncbi:Pre-mRNA-splicing factor cef1 [Pichia californica]|uniref:Pre-mRNA-splicing factor CEF1 n=1 Tax=Pichia californica TaxID=460514 RepID=A0A9P6WMT3_9ASCO|nr:Pre-mRNA-splicing factor cef1 [[Candida] californica]KAG0689875.1 Pre-mRNA-splicing factor cef1 [[Candida] californica]
MVPVYVKGGLWTNVEDEILKAAIAKYGLNQWSRVSSLLTKKNAKQCKLRWQEWLDPRIRKSDWSPEEDRRLLNLSKLRPNQWSSISLLLNRTANQCIERYQELLANYSGTENEALNDKLLLTGNIESSGINNKSAGSALGGLNLNPESRPAREDLDEMDDDEKEMISEAKARLANTQGKKAKRKAREKILNESRRVADLLRRRELKQVGVNAKLKLKKQFKDQMDYSADIAFERRPESEKFDISGELFDNLKEKRHFDKNVEVKGTFNQEVQSQKRKEKRRREQNKKLVESQNNKTKPGEEETDDDDDDDLYSNELSKRRKLTFTDIEKKDDIDDVIGETLHDLRETTEQKSVLFSSKKRRYDDSSLEVDKETSHEKDVIKLKNEKAEKKKKKQETKRVVELLNSLPEAIDDFEIDIDIISEDKQESNVVSSIHTIKQKMPQVIVDKTELRRVEMKKLGELQDHLNNIQIPQAVRNNLPIPFLPVAYKSLNEIDSVMIELIRNGNNSEKIDSIGEIENMISLWTEIENKVDEETKNIMNSTEYKNKKIFDFSKSVSHSKNSLLYLIRQYTEKSVLTEQQISEAYSAKKSEFGIDSTLNKIRELREQIEILDAELWVYEQFEKMESDSIKLRKERIQKELDYTNQLIEKKKQELFSKL